MVVAPSQLPSAIAQSNGVLRTRRSMVRHDDQWNGRVFGELETGAPEQQSRVGTGTARTNDEHVRTHRLVCTTQQS